MQKLNTGALFTHRERSIVYDTLLKFEYPWEIIPHITKIVKSLGKSLSPEEYYSTADGVYISISATVARSAVILPPAIIMSGAEIRHSAYIRGSVIVGRGAVVGNSTEVKNSILFDSVEVPHFNYIGDSILGYKAHLGAGAVTSNIKSDRTNVTISYYGERVETGLRKFGAILGDFVEVGCGSVLNPGTVIGPDTIIYPLTSVRGFIPEHSIVKSGGVAVEKRG